MRSGVIAFVIGMFLARKGLPLFIHAIYLYIIAALIWGTNLGVL